jgi:AraC-like DNA-binding protein
VSAERQAVSLEALRAYVERYPQGGRIPAHSHDVDQLALISQSAAVVETDAVYVVHPLLKALWLPAGVEHSVYSPRPFSLHSLYFPAGSVRADEGPQVLGLDGLARELVLFLCTAPRPSQRDARHAHALALLEQWLAAAKPDSFSLPKPRSERARKLAEHFTSRPGDGRALEAVAAEIGGASLRTFERLFLDETGLSLAAWRRQSRMLASLSLLAEGKSMTEIARAVGYDSAAAFSTAFKQCFGVSPSAYASGGEE